MDVHFLLHGQKFVWDSEKAAANESKHGVRFETACEAFFDPFVRLIEAGVSHEQRDAALGFDERGMMLFVVHVWREDDVLRIISARAATSQERSFYEECE